MGKQIVFLMEERKKQKKKNPLSVPPPNSGTSQSKIGKFLTDPKRFPRGIGRPPGSGCTQPP